jgi:hypothetical protein
MHICLFIYRLLNSLLNTCFDQLLCHYEIKISTLLIISRKINNLTTIFNIKKIFWILELQKKQKSSLGFEFILQCTYIHYDKKKTKDISIPSKYVNGNTFSCFCYRYLCLCLLSKIKFLKMQRMMHRERARGMIITLSYLPLLNFILLLLFQGVRLIFRSSRHGNWLDSLIKVLDSIIFGKNTMYGDYTCLWAELDHHPSSLKYPFFFFFTEKEKRGK